MSVQYDIFSTCAQTLKRVPSHIGSREPHSPPLITY